MRTKLQNGRHGRLGPAPVVAAVVAGAGGLSVFKTFQQQDVDLIACGGLKKQVV